MSDAGRPPGLIPDRLLNDTKTGDRILFLGADWPLGYAGAPPSRPELAQALAARDNLQRNQAWPETAQGYLAQFPADRQGLASFVLEQTSRPPVKPGRLHAAIARAGFRAIVTAWYDELLEEALRDAGYRVNRVVRDQQLAFAQQGERETIVIKLFGCRSDPASLVLTAWDHAELLDQLNRKLEIVTALCTLRPPLFVNWDMTTDMPMRLFVRASAHMTEYMRRAYAVWPQPVADIQAVWRDRNVEFVQADAAAFLETLAAQLPHAAAMTAAGPVRVQRPPYKFLDYFTPEDAPIFCGRDIESQDVLRLTLAHRWLTLFGPSGAGKTSLLLAGVVPRLAAEGYQPVYVRALDDPLPALRKAIAARAGSDQWTAGGNLRSFLSALLAPQDKLIILLDQFEELFLRVGEAAQTAFFREMAEALHEPEREVRVVCSLREDYLAQLDVARPFLPEVFTHSRRLTVLPRVGARVAITEPAARAGVTVEATLVEALVGAETRQGAGPTGGDLVEKDGLVPPAALQIVLDRLYRAALPAGHTPEAPPPAGLTLTLAAYRAIRHRQRTADGERELRGAEAILAGYVEQGLARLAELSADPDLGRAILKVMVTSQATKAALTPAEIVAWLEEAGDIRAGHERDRRRVEDTRLGLERVRLLRGFERDGQAYYELAHDHLAAEIATWISAAEVQRRLARELLRREMDNWRGAGLLIRPEVLALIDERRTELTRLGKAELELLFRSTLAAGGDAPYWFERARSAGVDVAMLAQAALRSPNFRARAAAVAALGRIGAAFADELMAALADDYPQVRVAAIRALERLQPDAAWHSRMRYECFVPAGPFRIGDDRGNSDEKPAHELNLAAFYIGKYPVTNADYQRYMDDLGRVFHIPAGKEQHPVVSVAWREAVAYAGWAGLRLLSEAEWEKAATWQPASADRGTGFFRRQPQPGRKLKYPWGDTFDAGKCNVSESKRGGTTPVGAYSPQGDSPYGAADMSGNVWEWTSSLYKPYPYAAADGREDPGDTDSRVIRGGAFYDSSTAARGAYRLNSVYSGIVSRGFRCGVGSGLFSPPPAGG